MKVKPVVTILVGESGSGKSTLARSMVKDDPLQNTVRLNRDDIRSMLSLKSSKRDLENLVVRVQMDMLTTAVRRGFDVVVDDTNLNPATAASILTFLSVSMRQDRSATWLYP